MTEIIKTLFQKPESETLEYKMSLSTISGTANLLSSFANTKGGYLIIGVNDSGIPTGVGDSVSIIKDIERATKKIWPEIEYKAETEIIDGKTLVVVYVPKGINAIYRVDDKIYQRRGAQTVQVDQSLINLDIHSSSIQAVTSGSVAQGEGAVAVGNQGILVGGDIKGTIVTGNNNSMISQSAKNVEVVPFNTAFERLSGSTTFVVDQLKISYEQTREQAKGWFRFSIIAALLGFVLIISGAIVAIVGQTTAGIITALASVIPNIASALFFAQSKSANERVDTILLQMSEAREILTSVEIANTIDDGKARDKLKAEIVRKALQIQK